MKNEKQKRVTTVKRKPSADSTGPEIKDASLLKPYSKLVNNLPVPIFEMQIEVSHQFIDGITNRTASESASYFSRNPEQLERFLECMKLIYANKSVLTLYGAESIEELAAHIRRDGRDVMTFLATEVLPDILRNGHSKGKEKAITTIAGDKRHVVMEFHMPEDGKAPMLRVIGLIFDITERIRAEEALRESEEKYRILFEDSPIPLWEADFSLLKSYIDDLKKNSVDDFGRYLDEHPEEVLHCMQLMRIVDFNRNVVRLMRCNSREEVVQNFSVLFCPELLRTHKTGFTKLAEGETIFEDETINNTMTGDKLHVAFRLAVPRGYEDTWSEVLLSCLDITRLKNTESELNKAYDELKKAHDELEMRVEQRTAELKEANRKLVIEIEERIKLQKELQQINSELEDFSFMVSHEVKNNLLMMSRMLEVMMLKTELIPVYSKPLIENSDRLIKFVSNLLLMARAGRTTEIEGDADLGALVKKLFLRLKPDDLEAKLSVSDSFPPVPCDLQGMEQVFTNLICNAIQHRDMEKESLRLSLAYRLLEDNIEIIFGDNGCGVGSNNIPRIFEVAFSTKSTSGGFGFGLAIVRKIIEAHKGSIAVRSEGEGKGTEFILTLPRSSRRPEAQ